MDWLRVVGIVADVLGIAAAVYTGWQAKRLFNETKRVQRQAHQSIDIYLQDEITEEKFKPPVAVARSALTRAEFMGLVGMVPRKKGTDRFNLPYLGKSEFLKTLKEAQSNEDIASIVIPCAGSEIAEFVLAEDKVVAGT